MGQVSAVVRSLLTINDTFSERRLRHILLDEDGGAVICVIRESQALTKAVAAAIRSRAEKIAESDARTCLKRFVGFLEDVVDHRFTTRDYFARLVDEPSPDQHLARVARGFLPARPGSPWTLNEEEKIRVSIVRLAGAGVAAVDGDYTFSKLGVEKLAGVYVKDSVVDGRDVRLYLYKCKVTGSGGSAGGYQWFVSLPPDGKNPGTKDDRDFYYATANFDSILPASAWQASEKSCGKGPLCTLVDPRARSVAPSSSSSSSSDSDEEDEDDEELDPPHPPPLQGPPAPPTPSGESGEASDSADLSADPDVDSALGSGMGMSEDLDEDALADDDSGLGGDHGSLEGDGELSGDEFDETYGPLSP